MGRRIRHHRGRGQKGIHKVKDLAAGENLTFGEKARFVCPQSPSRNISGRYRRKRGSQNQDSTKFTCFPLLFSMQSSCHKFRRTLEKNGLWPCLMELKK